METISTDVRMTLPAVGSAVGDGLVEELFAASGSARLGVTRAEFAGRLGEVGARYNFGVQAGGVATTADRASFLRGLRVEELGLALGCGLGRDAAWERFLAVYKGPLTAAAVAMAGSATVGHDVADALWGELYGLKERDGVRRSPLDSYSGRGSLMGWLRTTLAQRQVDHHRRTYREVELGDEVQPAAAEEERVQGAGPVRAAVTAVLAGLTAEERYLLSAYYLDQCTLAVMARLLRVHEATVSRRLKRLTEGLRKGLLKKLQADGLSRRAAEEALGVDVRDVELDVRGLLQEMESGAISVQGRAGR